MSSTAAKRGANSDPELQTRVVYSLLQVVAAIAQRCSIPMKDVEDWLQMASFQEARDKHRTLHEVADALGVSISKAALLSKRLKTNFLQPDSRVGVARRIEFLLWAAPLSKARIAQALPDIPDAKLSRGLAKLLRDDRIVLKKSGRTEVYERAKENSRLVSQNVEARLDALENLLDSLRETVWARFFSINDSALARTVRFRLRRQDLGEIKKLYEQKIWPRIIDLEKRADQAADSEEVTLSLLFSPTPTKE